MDFDDGYWWDFDREEIRFRGRDDDGSVVFCITQVAICDWFDADDNEAEAERLFEDNRDWFEQIALNVLVDNDGDAQIRITGDVLRAYGTH